MADHRVLSQQANTIPHLPPNQLHGQVRHVAFLTVPLVIV
jgi:hypothetical protein